jgi:hypothetical protein
VTLLILLLVRFLTASDPIAHRPEAGFDDRGMVHYPDWWIPNRGDVVVPDALTFREDGSVRATFRTL